MKSMVLCPAFVPSYCMVWEIALVVAQEIVHLHGPLPLLPMSALMIVHLHGLPPLPLYGVLLQNGVMNVVLETVHLHQVHLHVLIVKVGLTYVVLTDLVTYVMID